MTKKVVIIVINNLEEAIEVKINSFFKKRAISFKRRFSRNISDFSRYTEVANR